MHPFALVKNLLRRQGIYVFRAGNLPRQIDLWADLKKIQPAPRVIFDIGANVGWFACAAANAYPSAMIHAFEPVSNSYKMLEKVASNKSRINPCKLALGASRGNARIYLRENSQWNSLAPANIVPTSDGDSEIVSVETVDEFCQAHQITQIDLLKTDTEGFDSAVLSGARRMLESSSIRVVYSEVTFCQNDTTHTQFQEVSKLLQPFDFVFYGLYEPGGAGEQMYSNALFVQRCLIRSPSASA